MKQIEIETTTTTKVMMDGHNNNDVIKLAAELAHCVLEELSMYRNDNDLIATFNCEDIACEFLDLIDD